MSKTLNNRWFALIVLICCTTSGFLWYINFQPTILPLVIGGVPLGLFILNRRHLSVSPLYHGLLAIFLLTATIGTWAAYQATPAIHKFWVILGAVLIFYALAAQPSDNMRAIFWGLGLCGAAIAGYFLMTFIPVEHPADLSSINEIMLSWEAIRPAASWRPLESNFVGGMLAVLVLCTYALLVAAWRSRHIIQAGLASGLLLFQTLSLWLTSSRSAWISLGVGIGVLIWWAVSRKVSSQVQTERARVFEAGLLVSLSLALVMLALFPSQLFAVAKSLPGAASASSRAGLFINAVDLIPDFWLTGGGLQSFAGLYSQYILVIPDLFFKYGYNLYLDVAIEQGIFGLVALLGIYGFAILSMLLGFGNLRKRSSTRRRFYPAVFAALIVLVINGMFDDPFYGEQSTPLLFMLPGLAVLMSAPHGVPVRQHQANKQPGHLPGFKYWASGLAVIFTGLAISFYQPLLAAVDSNLGSVAMSKAELHDFPMNEWKDLPPPGTYAEAESYFQQALWYNPAQRTANHRLGRIALQARDFETAAGYLETAYQSDPGHRGIRKALGYTYVWLGQIQKASQLLSILPETEREMTAYIGWWQNQGRSDLAEQAQRMVEHLKNVNIP